MKGDKVAGYGLTALVVGGAAAAAVKTGLFAKLIKFLLVSAAALWKFMLAIVLGIGAFIKKLFNRAKQAVGGEETIGVATQDEQRQLTATARTGPNDQR